MNPEDEPRLDPRLIAQKPSADHQDYSRTETASRLRATRAWWQRHARDTVHRTSRYRPAGKVDTPEPRYQPGDDGDFITKRPDQPWLLWMDTDGVLHAEQELSAEELIRRWQATQEQDTT